MRPLHVPSIRHASNRSARIPVSIPQDPRAFPPPGSTPFNRLRFSRAARGEPGTRHVFGRARLEEPRKPMTLRITREEGSGSRATLKLEGSVVAEWSVLLERECSDLLRFAASVCLDLAGVGFVDRAGVEALDRLSRSG